MPFGIATAGEMFDEDLGYASVMGMLLYMSSNPISEIQFEVHQCTRLKQTLRKSHVEFLKLICRCFKLTQEKGLIFSLTSDLNPDYAVDADFMDCITMRTNKTQLV